MNTYQQIKRGNSKGALAKALIIQDTAIKQYQRALAHYADESHWAVKGDDIVWVGDDDPTMAAQVTLGQRKTANNNVREPDKKEGK